MSSHIFTLYYYCDIWMYLSGLIFSLHSISQYSWRLNKIKSRICTTCSCQIMPNLKELWIHNKITNTAIQDACSCQILPDLKVIGMYLSELLNVFVKFHTCDACLSNSARSQGSSEWEGVCFVRRGVKISRARQVSVYININTNTNRWWFKYRKI